MNNFSFTLNWSDLPKELRESKITEYLEIQFEQRFDPEYRTAEAEKEYINDERGRRSAEINISSRFPVQF